MAIKVSIYEDNASLLESMSYLIRGAGSFELCTASISAIRIVDDCKNNCPDIILMDIDMPEMSGIEATRLVKAAFPELNVMILTIFEDKDKIFDALCAGATGYLLKKTPSAKIIEAIEELHRGGSPMSSGIARKALEFFSKPSPSSPFSPTSPFSPSSPTYQLSPRETEILKRLVMGDSYKMVADACCISIGTVYSHINNQQFSSNTYRSITTNKQNLFRYADK